MTEHWTSFNVESIAASLSPDSQLRLRELQAQGQSQSQILENLLQQMGHAEITHGWRDRAEEAENLLQMTRTELTRERIKLAARPSTTGLHEVEIRVCGKPYVVFAKPEQAQLMIDAIVTAQEARRRQRDLRLQLEAVEARVAKYENEGFVSVSGLPVGSKDAA